MKILPSYERLHELFEYRDGALYYKNDLYDSLGRMTSIKKGSRAGGLHPLGYRKMRVDGVIYMEHRIIWKMFNKHFEIGTIDHINNKTDDNRIENMRLATVSENNQNARMRKDNTSGVKGVSWNKRDKVYAVAISVNGKRKIVGTFVDFELAELVANEARDKFHGKFANYGIKI